jgi:hypothetical protein
MKMLINLVAGPVAAALLCVASVSPSHAQTTAYVSGKGLDTNACTLSAPCRTAGHALTVAGDGGTISCLDAGPYFEGVGSNFSFTLDCRGVVYEGLVFSNIISTTGGSSQHVTIRHVIFDGALGGVAVQIGAGTGNVVVENCTFQNFTAPPGVAIQFSPQLADAHLTITDSVFTNNGTGTGGGGVIIQPSGARAKATAVIERTQVTGNTYGIVANGSNGTALVDIRYSSVAGNVLDGIWSYAGGFVTSIVVEHSASVQNGGNGINATGANAFVSLNDSTVAWNTTGLATSSSGTILSYKNNVIAGNLSPGVTPTGVNQQ